MNEEVKNAKEPKKAISIIKKYEEPLKGENSTIINLVGKQGELLKKFKEDDEFFGHVGLSGSNIYFNIGLHKFLCKIPILKKSALMSNYFKSNLKLITKVYMANVDDLVGKSKKVVKSICFIIFHPCLDNFV